MRAGIGYDIHRMMTTVEPSQIPVGGVGIPCHFKIESHSDGDVLLHATVDSLLGGLALGDIGQWFPDTAPENKGRPSAEFVTRVLEKVHSMGWEVNQMDAIIHLERPRLAEHSFRIRESLARLLQVELEHVSVKMKSGEGLGPIGNCKAIAAHTIVMLRERSRS